MPNTPPGPFTNSDEPSPERLAAEGQSAAWLNVDPFPGISPSLLNSADIDDYMRTTAMVYPYRPEKRKTASYPLRVGNEIAFWSPDTVDPCPVKLLKEGDGVTIPSNSIIYVRTKELFQLPNYMAVRFNLHIDLVHKGLLLGTGPLVDPGFTGKLMVPLHNLTSNEYVLQVGDEFIWAEFTKTSLIDKWTDDRVSRPARDGRPVQFEARKRNNAMADYLNKAKQGHPRLQKGFTHTTLQNAIPESISRTEGLAQSAEQSATAAEARAARIEKRVRGFGLAAVFAGLLALGAVLLTSWSSYQTTQGIVASTNVRVADQAGRIKDLEVLVGELQENADPRLEAAPGQPPQSSEGRRSR